MRFYGYHDGRAQIRTIDGRPGTVRYDPTSAPWQGITDRSKISNLPSQSRASRLGFEAESGRTYVLERYDRSR